jgi:predicted AlkP superfamily phosphohydrolase/phosphomutase
MNRKTIIRATQVATLLALALLAGLGGCGRSETPHKVVLIGIDGMDWQIADPLLEKGLLPNIQSLIDRGAKINLRSIGPEMKSPIIWTCIATGKTQHKHGISDFLKQETGVQALYNSLGWKVLAVWQMLGNAGRTVGVINWWLSWPAYPVNGFLITERITFAPEDGYPDIPEVTTPPELADELAPLRQPVTTLSDDVLAPFLVGDAWRTTDDHTVKEGLESFRGIYAMDKTVLEVAKHMFDTRDQPDLFAVYFQGLDVTCHRYWGQWDTTSVDIQTSAVMNETFSELIPRYYVHFDEVVGELLDHMDDDSTVIICSDHGFRGPFRSPRGLLLGIWMHRQTGVMIAAGPGIDHTTEPLEASVFDITPTILALLGEPVARDMDGFVLSEIINDDFEAAHPVTYVETYEREPVAAGEAPETEAVDDAIREKLRSLGYIQ